MDAEQILKMLQADSKKPSGNAKEQNEALQKALDTIRQQQDILKRIADEPLAVGIVLQTGIENDKYIMLGMDSDAFRVLKPEFPVMTGMYVACNLETRNPVCALPDYIPSGEFVSATAVNLEQGWVEVETGGNVKRVRLAQKLEGFEVRKGDRLLLDESESLAILNYGADQSKHNVEEVPDVTWDDICGLEEAKMQMREAIEFPHTHNELYSYYGKKACKGLLLYGNPGCGKTLLAKAASNALSKIYSKVSASSAFIYVKAPELLNKYVGESEAQIRAIFERARKHKAEHGYPALVFIDEAEAILAKRGDRSRTSGMQDTMVPMFLAEMDGLHDSAAVVVLATNLPDSLDSAVVRDGRIDRKVKVTAPTAEAAEQIVINGFKRMPFGEGLTKEEAGALAIAELYNDDHVLFEIFFEGGSAYDMPIKEAVNGAMVAGIAEYAAQLAMRRDMNSGAAPQGITRHDVIEAVERIVNQARDLDHSVIVENFLGEKAKKPYEVRKAKPIVIKKAA